MALILDLGLHSQVQFLKPEDQANYRFVFSGLTPSEARQLELLDEDDAERTIPWAFVGHMTPHRVALVDHLVQSVDPRGFVYMPAAAPYTETGSPHLNQQQFERVLDRTRYQVWCSHHRYFYMEPERFRSSLLTGGVPVKVVDSRQDTPESAPLGYLMMERADVGERLTGRVFPGCGAGSGTTGAGSRRLPRRWRGSCANRGSRPRATCSRRLDRQTPGPWAWHPRSPGTKHLLRQGMPGAAPSRALFDTIF